MSVVASTEYQRSAFWRMLFGEAWRDVWATRIEVPVLDLATYAGGLTPVRQGGNQSKTLHLKGGDGRSYVFRSTNKNIHKALNDDLAHTPVGDLIQDQTAAFHPAGHPAVAVLHAAVGLLHAPPTVVVMPDDPRLGEFRADFKDLLGQIEERPDDPEGGPVFANAEKIVGPDNLLESLETSMEDRFDSRDYLKARLIDFMVGDPDRGGDQWEFAKFEAGERDVYRPIPRDRDYAFMKVEGLLMRLGAAFYPKLVRWGDRYPGLASLVFMSRDFDRSQLVDLSWADWEAVVRSMQQDITNEVIARAIARLPDPYRQKTGASLALGLQARRDALHVIARDFFDMVNLEADVFASDENERAEITRQPDGSLTVRIWREGAGGELATNGSHAPAFERRFLPEETREVRVFLERGDDRAIVRGSVARSITVRVIGGEGDDVLIDSAHVAEGDATHFYDASGDNTFVRGARTRVVEKAYDAGVRLRPDDDDEPEEDPRMLREERRGRFKDQLAQQENFVEEKTREAGARNWGAEMSWSPLIGYAEDAGVIVGFGPTLTEYGFRRRPHEWQVALRGMVGIGNGDLGVRLAADRHFENSRWSVRLDTHASQLEAIRFFGYGNDTEFVERTLSLVPNSEVLVQPALRYGIDRTSHFEFGPVLKYVSSDPVAGSPAARLAPLGIEPFGQVGARAELLLDRTLATPTEQRGVGLQLGASGYPAAWDAVAAFGEAHALVRLFVPLGWPTLALRAGGQRVWGEFPLHEAAFIGGRQTLRGFTWNRFAGDRSAFGSAELRAPLGRVTLLTRGQLGVHGFTDAGRVWIDGESAGDWHTSRGGGVWFSSLGRSLSVSYAKGEQGRLYIDFGMPF